MNETPTQPVDVPEDLTMSTIAPPVVSAPVSPTGKARVSPVAVPYIAAGWVGLAAAIQALPPGQAQTWGHFALLVLGPVLGMFCPGLRQTPGAPMLPGRVRLHVLIALALAIAFMAALTGCASLKSWWSGKGEPAVVDCGKQDAAKLLEVAPVVVQALMQQNYIEAVDVVGADLGVPLVQCVVAELNAQPNPQPVPAASGLALMAQAPPMKQIQVKAAAEQYILAKGLTALNVKPMIAGR